MSTNAVNKTTGELITLANGTRMWIGTKTAHDLAVQQGTMPNNCMVCITDDAAGEEAWEYSTSETNTGKKWIDGKPIYRKVVECGALPDSTTKRIPTGVSNLETLIDIKGTAYSSDAAIPLPFIDLANISSQIRIYYESSTLSVALSTSRDYAQAYPSVIAIIEYTKNTD